MLLGRGSWTKQVCAEIGIDNMQVETEIKILKNKEKENHSDCLKITMHQNLLLPFIVHSSVY